MSIPPVAKLALGAALIVAGIVLVATSGASVVGAIVLMGLGLIHIAEGIGRLRG